MIPEPSSLQLNSFSQGPWSPEQLLRRSGLSLGSGLRTGPSQKSSKGFDRGSAAGGILDQLQMPNRLGLKFPNRNFGREKAARPASPVLAPLPSPPVPSSPLRSPPKPASNTDGNVAAASSGKQTASAAAASQKAPSVTSAADSEPEHKRRLHSRFTEEHLIQLLPDRGTAPIRELPNSPAAQPSIEAESEPPAQHAVSMQTQTSTVQELALDSDMPLHGFRRHMSLRDPLVGIEQLNAVVASRQLRHESAGSSNDDIMASAQQAAIARRRSSADRLNIAQSNNSVDTQPLVASVDVATAQDSAASPATEESQAEPATEAEAADEADESLAYSQSAAVPTGSASMVDDSYISAQRDIAVDAAVDAVQTDAVQQFEAGVVADANDVVDQLNTEAVDASHTEQDETVGESTAHICTCKTSAMSGWYC